MLEVEDMSFGDAAFGLLKDQLLPELAEMKQDIGGIKQDIVGIKQDIVGIKQTLNALVTRLEHMDRESARRFDLIDKHFELMEKRIQDQGAEHSRRMDLFDMRMDLFDKRMERFETTSAGMNERITLLTDAVGRLTLLGDYVRRVDEMAAELRELRRRQEDFERRMAEEVLPRLPKVGT